jgi:MbtH protein
VVAIRNERTEFLSGRHIIISLARQAVPDLDLDNGYCAMGYNLAYFGAVKTTNNLERNTNMPKRIYSDAYKVVINHEEQYSIIPKTETLTKGWKEVGKIGTVDECLNYIEEVWTDMTPKDKDRILRDIA